MLYPTELRARIETGELDGFCPWFSIVSVFGSVWKAGQDCCSVRGGQKRYPLSQDIFRRVQIVTDATNGGRGGGRRPS